MYAVNVTWQYQARLGDGGWIFGEYSNGRGVIIGGDGIDLIFTEGRRSPDSTPAVRDPGVETTERSDTIDFRGSSGSCSRGGDGGVGVTETRCWES